MRSPFHDLPGLERFLAASAHQPMDEPGLFELDHALQCAAHLATEAPGDEGLQLAGLLHDVAHGLCPIEAHDRVGEALLRPLLDTRIARLVGLHVQAKRYLVSCDAAYRDALSMVSTASLARQGGALDAAGRAAFEADPLAAAALLLRKADEQAKTPGRAVPPLAHWLPVLRRHAAGA